MTMATVPSGTLKFVPNGSPLHALLVPWTLNSTESTWGGFDSDGELETGGCDGLDDGPTLAQPAIKAGRRRTKNARKKDKPACEGEGQRAWLGITLSTPRVSGWSLFLC